MNDMPINTTEKDLQKEPAIAKISLIIVVTAAIFWLGAVNIRAVIGNDLLVFGTIEFKSNINPLVERSVFGLIAKSSIVVLGWYSVLWIAGIVFLSATRLKFKQNGWLLMSAILFYLFTPVEVYQLILDGKMVYQDFFTKGELVEFRKLFIHRLAALQGVPIIAQFCYYTIIVLVVIQPLKRPDL
jgi:hypothetical protein